MKKINIILILISVLHGNAISKERKILPKAYKTLYKQTQNMDLKKRRLIRNKTSNIPKLQNSILPKNIGLPQEKKNQKEQLSKKIVNKMPISNSKKKRIMDALEWIIIFDPTV